jgi:DNA-binding NarL/FixJ family response regulator
MLLPTAVTQESELPIFDLFGSARILLAAVYLKMGLTTDALAETTAALTEVTAQGAPGRILLEGATALPLLQLAVTHARHTVLANHLLESLTAGAQPAPQPITIVDTGETLSIREVEVLRLIASGANNQMIAETLVLSPHTVKRHVANILAKLNVSSRTQAATRAQTLGMLG